MSKVMEKTVKLWNRRIRVQIYEDGHVDLHFRSLRPDRSIFEDSISLTYEGAYCVQKLLLHGMASAVKSGFVKKDKIDASMEKLGFIEPGENSCR